MLNIAVLVSGSGSNLQAIIDEMKKGRQMQIVNLVRQLLLKRFESSIAAFEETCIRIFVRLQKFIQDYREYGNEREITRFYQRKQRIFDYIQKYLDENTPYTLEELEDDGEIYESIEDIWPDYPSKDDFFWNEEEY